MKKDKGTMTTEKKNQKLTFYLSRIPHCLLCEIIEESQEKERWAAL